MRRATAARQIPPPQKKDKIMEINGNPNIDRMGGSIRPHKKSQTIEISKKMKITGGTPIEMSKQSKFQKNNNENQGGDPLPRSAGKCRK